MCPGAVLLLHLFCHLRPFCNPLFAAPSFFIQDASLAHHSRGSVPHSFSSASPIFSLFPNARSLRSLFQGLPPDQFLPEDVVTISPFSLCFPHSPPCFLDHPINCFLFHIDPAFPPPLALLHTPIILSWSPSPHRSLIPGRESVWDLCQFSSFFASLRFLVATTLPVSFLTPVPLRKRCSGHSSLYIL